MSIESINREIEANLKNLAASAKSKRVLIHEGKSRVQGRHTYSRSLSPNTMRLQFSSAAALGDAIRKQAVDEANIDAQHGEVKVIKGYQSKLPDRMSSCNRRACSFLRFCIDSADKALKPVTTELNIARGLAGMFKHFNSIPEPRRHWLCQSWGVSRKELEALVRIYHLRWKTAKEAGL